MSRRERWLWTLLALAVAASRLLGLGDRAFSHDESLHGFYSYQLATRGIYQHDPMMHGPLQFHLNALVFRLVGASDTTARLTAAVAGIGAVLLLLAFRPLLGRRGAFLAATLAALSPSLAFYSRYMRNESYVAFACLLWSLGAFRYLASRRRADLGWMVLGMGIAFAAKEVAFLFGATIGLFFLTLAVVRARRGGEPFVGGAAGDVALVNAVLVAPFLGALLHLPFGWSTVAFDDPAAPGRALVTSGSLALVALAVGLLLARGRSRGRPQDEGPAPGLSASTLTGLALGFWSALALLFTTLGSNAPRGLVSGFVGSLGYWLAQHGVQRGSQPVYYYLLLVVLYELLPLGAALLAVPQAWRRLGRRGGAAVPAADLPPTAPNDAGAFAMRRAWLAFLLWWSGAGLVLYSLAGERMPWLTVHIVLPWLLTGGWGLARAFAAWRERVVWRAALIGAVALAALATAAASARLLYRDADLATEMLVYAHGTPDLHRVADAIAARAATKGPGERVVVAHDSATSWPLLWYLRDTDHRYLTHEVAAADLAGVDLLLLSPEASRKAWPLVARDFEELELLQLWWPVEGYREPSRLATREGWQAAWSYWLTRRLPGVEVGPHWPLRQEMRLLVRRAGAARGPLPTLAVPVLPLEIWRDPATDRPRENGAAPVAVAADAAGRVLVGDLLTHELLRFDRALRPLAADAVEGGVSAAAIAPGEGGTAAVVDAETGLARLFDAAGRELARWGEAEGQQGARPTGLVRQGDGFALSDAAGSRICFLSARLEPRGACVPLEFAPEALAAGAADLLVADAAGRRVVRLRDGRVTAAWPFPGWEGVPAVGRPGLAELGPFVLATDPGGHRLVVFTAAGEVVATLEPRDRDDNLLWKRPEGLAVDRTGGRLLLADRDGGKLYALPLPRLEAELASLASSTR